MPQPAFSVHHVNSLRDRVRVISKQIGYGIRDPEMRRVSLAVSAGDTWTLRDFATRHGYRPLDLGGLRGCAARDDACELTNMFEFIRRNVRYTGDIAGLDTYVTARKTIFELRGGDCDDHTIALSTLGAHNGFSMLARAVAPTGSVDKRGRPVIGHVYAVALVPKMSPGAGTAMDTTLPRGFLGLEPRSAEQVDFLL